MNTQTIIILGFLVTVTIIFFTTSSILGEFKSVRNSLDELRNKFYEQECEIDEIKSSLNQLEDNTNTIKEQVDIDSYFSSLNQLREKLEELEKLITK